MRTVAIDDRGAYYYTDTKEEAIISFEGGYPFDIYTGDEVMIVVMDDRGDIIRDISDDVAQSLIAIFGNRNQIPPARTVPDQVRTTAIVTPRPSVYQLPSQPQQTDDGLLPSFSGGKIQIGTTGLIVGSLFLLFFFFGKRGR